MQHASGIRPASPDEKADEAACTLIDTTGNLDNW